MTAPNRNALWARTVVEELVAGGVEAVCVAPGSRSTPLTVACYEHEDLQVFSHLDERSAAFFALGRARRTGRPTPLVCTSGTAAANFHPAVLEADGARVPMVLLTADRPPELRDSGANQTVDQVDLYGDAVRWFRDLPEPEPADRKLRRLRVDVGRAVATATGTPAGPVHLNVPFRKPLEPVHVVDDVGDANDGGDDGGGNGDVHDRGGADDGASGAPGLGATGRPGPFVRTELGTTAPASSTVERLADAVEAADRILVVAGPASATDECATALADLAAASGAPLLADPLSGARFGSHVEACPLVCGGYDAYVGTAAVDRWPEPAVVLRVGASPTSKALRRYLAGTDARQVLVDAAGEWRDAEFTTTDLVVADPGATVTALAGALDERGVEPDAEGRVTYRERFARAEAEHWALTDRATPDGTGDSGAGERDADRDGADRDVDAPANDDAVANDDGAANVEAATSTEGAANVDAEASADGAANGDGARTVDAPFEGAVVPAVLAAVPDRTTVFASNSMPVRDLDRFARPSTRDRRALANRGASGIDGIASTALGAASAADEPLVAIVGDVAFYHDSNGLLAAGRCDIDATIVLVNNDGGGIFHALPIEAYDPPFTEGFRTPHGLDFEPLADAYDASYSRVDVSELTAACEAAVGSSGLDVLEVAFDAASSHRTREALEDRLDDRLRASIDASD